jgi:hypothetical protein
LPKVLLEQARLWLDNSVALLASPADLERELNELIARRDGDGA